MDSIVLIFSLVFFTLESLEQLYREQNKSDLWHCCVWIRAVILSFLLGYISYSQQPITIPWYKLILIIGLIRWFVMDNLLNLFRGRNIFEVGTTSWIDRSIRRLSKIRWGIGKYKSNMHHELIAINLKIALTIIIFKIDEIYTKTLAFFNSFNSRSWFLF